MCQRFVKLGGIFRVKDIKKENSKKASQGSRAFNYVLEGIYRFDT
jgi:hypothetical protein